jgi:hypothetical protein
LVEPLRLDAEALAVLKLDAAIEGARPGNLFPSRVAWVACQGNPRLISVVEGELAHGYRLRPVEIVRVPKQDRTTRPAADMPQRDQLVYAGLVAALRAEVPDGFVTFTGEGEDEQSYRDFEEFPLTVEGTSHVLEADAAAFYQYIDHERLAYELIGLTGMAQTAEVLVTALEGWMGATRGLPQGPLSSQPLADIYIAPAARALARAGFALSRFSDDFRVPVGNWAAVKRAQLALEEAFYDIGLSVAPGKLKTPRIETYRRWLETANDPRVTGAASIAALAAMENEEYFAGEWEPANVTEEQVANAAEVLAEQHAALHVTVTTTRLVRRSIGLLASARSPRAVPLLPFLLTQYAHLTPAVCSYLSSVVQSDNEAAGVDAVVEQLTGPRSPMAWQVGWLLHALSLANTPRDDVAEVARPRLFDESLPWFARSAAARATAVHGALPPLDGYFGVYERATDAARPDLVAAVIVAEPSWKSRFLGGIGTDPLLRDITDYAPEVVRQWF